MIRLILIQFVSDLSVLVRRGNRHRIFPLVLQLATYIVRWWRTNSMFRPYNLIGGNAHQILKYHPFRLWCVTAGLYNHSNLWFNRSNLSKSIFDRYVKPSCSNFRPKFRKADGILIQFHGDQRRYARPTRSWQINLYNKACQTEPAKLILACEWKTIGQHKAFRNWAGQTF